jgi:hypothetical protein
MNYTIKRLEGEMDTSKIVACWKDDAAGKIHTNVFAPGCPCTFLSSIKQEDEFFFPKDASPIKGYAVCLAFYPAPPKRLAVKVMDQ